MDILDHIGGLVLTCEISDIYNVSLAPLYRITCRFNLKEESQSKTKVSHSGKPTKENFIFPGRFQKGMIFQAQ